MNGREGWQSRQQGLVGCCENGTNSRHLLVECSAKIHDSVGERQQDQFSSTIIATTAHTVDSNWRAASVTIVDLAAGTTVTGVELFEAVQTVSGIGQSKIGGHASINADRGVFQDEMRVGQKNRRSGQPTWASFWGDFSSVGSQLPSGYRGVRLRAPLVPRASERRYFQPRHV